MTRITEPRARYSSASCSIYPSPSLRSENRLRDHAVDALGAVDHLGDMIIDRDARNHVGLLARKLGETLGDEKDGLAYRHLHRLLEVRVEAHYDPVGGRFAARPRDLHVFAHDELELAA